MAELSRFVVKSIGNPVIDGNLKTFSFPMPAQVIADYDKTPGWKFTEFKATLELDPTTNTIKALCPFNGQSEGRYSVSPFAVRLLGTWNIHTVLTMSLGWLSMGRDPIPAQFLQGATRTYVLESYEKIDSLLLTGDGYLETNNIFVED